jgi:hypothetical protein
MQNEKKVSRRDFLKCFVVGLGGGCIAALLDELSEKILFPMKTATVTKTEKMQETVTKTERETSTVTTLSQTTKFETIKEVETTTVTKLKELEEEIKELKEKLNSIKFPEHHRIFAYGTRDLKNYEEAYCYGELLSTFWNGGIFPHYGNYENTQILHKIAKGANSSNPKFEISIQLEGYARDPSRAEGILKGVNKEVEIENVAIYDADEFVVKEKLKELKDIIKVIGKAGNKPLVDVNPYIKKNDYEEVVELVNEYNGAFSSHSPSHYEFLREQPVEKEENFYEKHVEAQKKQERELKELGAKYYYTIMISHIDPNLHIGWPENLYALPKYIKEIEDSAKGKIIDYSFDEQTNGTSIPINLLVCYQMLQLYKED